MTLVVRSRENSLEKSLECERAREEFLCGQADQGLPRSTTMFRMKEARTTLVAASPPRPGKQQSRAARRWPEQVSQQMTYFGGGERKQGTSWRCFLLADRLGGGYPSLGTDTCKTCLG